MVAQPLRFSEAGLQPGKPSWEEILIGLLLPAFPKAWSIQKRERSRWHPGVTWGISDAIACVNGFVLKGNYDSFTAYQEEFERWANFRTMLTQDSDTVDIDQNHHELS